MKIPNPAKSLPLPPGDLGLPLIGQDKIFRQNPQHFREELYQKYGAISKTRLRGQNYIYLHGYEAVKFSVAEHRTSLLPKMRSPKN